MSNAKSKKHIAWFKELGIKDVPLVGGKNASLGEMYRTLTGKGVHVPNGFAITAVAYHYFLEEAGIKKEIRHILSDLNTRNMKNLSEHGAKVRKTILSATLPLDLQAKIALAYKQLEKEYGKNCDVAVRSSATAEDLPDASFAGQQETYLDIRGPKALMEACKRCFASLFTNRAISYRVDKGFDHFSIGLSIGVQKMVRSDKACSGVMFSIDTETGFRNAVLINGAWGLGENVVQGAVTPDEYYVFKPTLGKYKPILTKKVGAKEMKMVYAKGVRPVKNIPTTEFEKNNYVLSDKEILQLAKWAVIIEDHYKKPMDMEWAKDGQTKKLFIVQARPETVQSRRDVNVLEEYSLGKKGKILVEGSPVGAKVGAGRAHIILDAKQIGQFKKGEVLVTDMTDPDWEPIMKIASAIITNRGGRTCHAAIISRELGIPCIVGTENATRKIKTGQNVTISCVEGEKGFVYEGILPYKVKKTNLKNLKRPRTKIMMNVGTPEQAFAESFIPNDGVGLARMEFIIMSYIRVHPLALINYPHLKDRQAIKEIASITKLYKDKKQFFVDQLASGVAMIAAAYYPKDVILRFSDFKTNEYANLIGGRQFEPKEDNPMIGWRGASRYYDDNYRQGFALECQAIRKVRDVMGLTNLKVMIPFCRTVEEGKAVLAEMAKNGLRRHERGLEVYVMCEIPSNVILADEFSKIFDGFSIGSNDLTQLTLGVDRDSELVAHDYDERNAAVKTLVSQVIKSAKKNKRKMGFCGQAPSDYPDFAQFLAREHIDSISLNPDTVVKTTIAVLKAEKGR
jgi:pyruvate, water dikinase